MMVGVERNLQVTEANLNNLLKVISYPAFYYH
jgi:hypothetical protein